MSQEILEQYYAAERAIKAYQKGIQQQLGIMHGLMHRLDAQIERSVPSPVAGHSGYAADDFPVLEQHAHYVRDDMACHGTEDAPDTPIRHSTLIANIHYCFSAYKITNIILSFIKLICCYSKLTDEEVVVYDHFPLHSMIVATFDRSGRRRRVRRMAPNLLSPFIAQPQTRQSAIKMDLNKQLQLYLMGTLTRGMLKHIILQFQMYEPVKISITLTYMVLVTTRNWWQCMTQV